jgi:hypothetical protein
MKKKLNRSKSNKQKKVFKDDGSPIKKTKSKDNSLSWTDFLQFMLDYIKAFLEIRVFDNNGNLIDRSWTRKIARVETLKEKYDGKHHIYFGAVSRKMKGGKKEDCREVPWLWVDIDFKDFTGGEKEARKILKEFENGGAIMYH